MESVMSEQPRRPGRKRQTDVSPKQQEVFELIVNSVAERGYQPTIREIADMLGVQSPAVIERLAQLVSKGVLRPPPPRSDRCYRLPGLKFLPYQVDDGGDPVEAEYEVGDYVVTVRKREQ